MPEQQEQAVGGDTEGKLRIKERDISWVPVNDEVVILDTRTSRYSNINEAGTTLWSALIDGATLRHLHALLVERYRLEPATAVRDVQSFLDMLRSRDLLAEL